jgi:hypothetical protein
VRGWFLINLSKWKDMVFLRCICIEHSRTFSNLQFHVIHYLFDLAWASASSTRDLFAIHLPRWCSLLGLPFGSPLK